VFRRKVYTQVYKLIIQYSCLMQAEFLKINQADRKLLATFVR
jgi:hypothetical protein